MDRRYVLDRLLMAFDNPEPDQDVYSLTKRYDSLRLAIGYNVFSVLRSKNDPVTRGLLWQVRETLIDMQSVMIGDGMDDPDLDARFANMRKCIDSELSVEAPPSPSVAEIWSRRFHALLNFCLRRKQSKRV